MYNWVHMLVTGHKYINWVQMLVTGLFSACNTLHTCIGVEFISGKCTGVFWRGRDDRNKEIC